jgi:uncharacterized protein
MHTNRLIDSTSPYLLQHAHNPVAWQPWDDAALAEARRLDKPIFLSIGYAACHWCHVMEHESFEDEATARVLNEHFVAIKVDREERPDLDEIYMNAVQLMGVPGGWPLNVFLTPDLVPFYGGSYFPREDALGMPGFRRVLEAVAGAYRDRRSAVEESAAEIARALRAVAAGETGEGGGAVPGGELEKAARARWQRTFDPEWGGFGDEPKFPPTAALRLLLSMHARRGDAEALRMAARTLDAMAAGGLYDQVGGGFHRYSVDRRWLVPHFEKMLYDNALLARTYVEAYQATGRPEYRRAARETLDYLLREMAAPGGGFCSSQDADTAAGEGAFYTWTPEEIAEAVPDDADAGLVMRFYGVTPAGRLDGRSILHATVPLEDFAASEGVGPDDLRRRLDGLRRRLLDVRSRRPQPARDDKVLADWNGMAVSAFAYAGAVLGEPSYVAAAEKTARFVLEKMHGPEGLVHTHRAGRSHTPAHLDDYACLLAGLLDLYEATFDAAWIGCARALADEMIARFWDTGGAGFFQTQAGRADLVARVKRIYDGAVPAAGAVAALALDRLAGLVESPDYRDRAERVLAVFSGAAARAPTAAASYLAALDFHAAPVRQIVIAGAAEDDGARALLEVVRRRLIPGLVVARVDPRAAGAAEDIAAVPALAGKTPVGGRAAAYVCDSAGCRPPITSAADLERLLKSDG